ncbi:MAG TPA: hypothetical protein VH590_13950 [Ktedonobacterales bacterium]
MADVMRFTVLDHQGTVSFVIHSSALTALVAACAEDPASLRELLDATRRYDRTLRDYVLNGLAVFDEHNLPEDHQAILQQLDILPAQETPVFRVVDERTRDVSLESVKAGVVLFNLPRKRIVQIQNMYDTIERAGTVNYHNGRFLSRREFEYELPPGWSIVP